jgi:hypothetical protein
MIDNKKQAKADTTPKKTLPTEPDKSRTPGRKLTREDLGRVAGGRTGVLIPGCCTQGCC